MDRRLADPFEDISRSGLGTEAELGEIHARRIEREHQEAAAELEAAARRKREEETRLRAEIKAKKAQKRRQEPSVGRVIGYLLLFPLLFVVVAVCAPFILLDGTLVLIGGCLNSRLPRLAGLLQRGYVINFVGRWSR